MNSCSIFQSFPFTPSMWAQGQGIRVSNLELIRRGTTPGSWHHLSLISTASWDGPCHCCVQGYPRLSLLSLFIASRLSSHPDTSTSLTAQLCNITELPEELHSYFSCLPAPLLSHQLPCLGREAELSLQTLLSSTSSSADTQFYSRQSEIRVCFGLRDLTNIGTEGVQLSKGKPLLWRNRNEVSVTGGCSM